MLAFIGGKVIRTSSIDVIEPIGDDEVNVLAGGYWTRVPVTIRTMLTAIEAVEKVVEHPPAPPIEVHATLDRIPPVRVQKGDEDA